MSNAEKIIALHKRRWELEEELSQVKARLSRIAKACDDKGIARLKSDGGSLEVKSTLQATYLGKGGAAERLEELGLEKYTYRAPSTARLGKYLHQYRHIEIGETWEDFVVRRTAWFQR